LIIDAKYLMICDSPGSMLQVSSCK